jgi:hypothetical protein
MINYGCNKLYDKSLSACIHNTSFSLQLINRPTKQDCVLGISALCNVTLQLTGPFSQVTKKMNVNLSNKHN